MDKLAPRSAENLSVLEIGAGTGWLLHHLAEQLPGFTFTGLEPDASYVAFAGERSLPNERYVNGFAETAVADLGGRRFDVVLSNDVLHHVTSLEKVFSAVAEVTRSGAEWWAIEPNLLNPYTHIRQRYGVGEQNFYPSAALATAVACGWGLRDRANLFLIPPFISNPPEWLQRLERKLERNPILAGGLVLHLGRA